MFDYLIPCYWDHDRDPDNYHQWINGITKKQLAEFFMWYSKTWMHDETGGGLTTDMAKQTLFNSIPIEQTFRSRAANEPFIYPLFHSYLMHNTIESGHAISQSAAHSNYYTEWLDLSPHLIDLISRKKGKIFVFNSWEAWPVAHWQTVIKTICQRYTALSPDDFIVGNQNLVNDQFMPAVSWAAFQEVCMPDLQHLTAIKDSIEQGQDRPFKFICLNRLPRPHRYHALVRLFEDRDIGLLSFLCTMDHMAWSKAPDVENYMLDYPKEIRSQLDDPHSKLSGSIDSFLYYCKRQDTIDAWYRLKIRDALPLLITDGVDGRTNPAYDESSNKFVNAYLHIVTETRGETSSFEMFLSEKIFKPVKYLQPFVVVANTGTLAAFNQLGYKTFDKWIDEAYDNIYDDEDRYAAAISSAKVFYNQPTARLNEILREMLPILEHNHNVLHNNIINLQVTVATSLMWHMVGIDRTISYEV